MAMHDPEIPFSVIHPEPIPIPQNPIGILVLFQLFSSKTAMDKQYILVPIPESS